MYQPDDNNVVLIKIFISDVPFDQPSSTHDDYKCYGPDPSTGMARGCNHLGRYVLIQRMTGDQITKPLELYEIFVWEEAVIFDNPTSLADVPGSDTSETMFKNMYIEMDW